MKIKKVTAYKSEDGCIWETQLEALEQNIENCFESLNYSSTNPHYVNMTNLKKWLCENPDKVKYIQDNYPKLNK